jgi:NAD(P)-dependent dehydrogenase (short-subunit alcohol dehydrogenase family)
MRLAGKVAVVTGGGSGIGRGIVLAMAREGADLAIPDIQVLNAEKVADEVKALGRRVVAMRTDVTSVADVKAMADRVREASLDKPVPEEQQRHSEGDDERREQEGAEHRKRQFAGEGHTGKQDGVGAVQGELSAEAEREDPVHEAEEREHPITRMARELPRPPQQAREQAHHEQGLDVRRSRTPGQQRAHVR